jgi:uncharacterized protein
MEDLASGMALPGVVTNVTRFGAFVDVGVHQDGLVHISKLADRFVRNPSDVVHVGQRVEVTVLDVDAKRRRISLSMRGASGDRPPRGKPPSPEKGKHRRRTSAPRDRKNAPFHNPFTDMLKPEGDS